MFDGERDMVTLDESWYRRIPRYLVADDALFGYLRTAKATVGPFDVSAADYLLVHAYGPVVDELLTNEAHHPLAWHPSRASAVGLG